MNYGRRWKVLQRDRFTCRYCGSMAPAVPLEVDHILPRSMGGRDNPENLVTACLPCNQGKKARDSYPALEFQERLRQQAQRADDAWEHWAELDAYRRADVETIQQLADDLAWAERRIAKLLNLTDYDYRRGLTPVGERTPYDPEAD